MGADLNCGSDFLKPFHARFHGGGHATTWYVFACCKWAAVASGAIRFWPAGVSDGVSEYLAALCAGAVLMVNGSLRWIDAQRNDKLSLESDAIDGFSPKTKSGPMHWWADKLDFLGGESWFAALRASHEAEPALTSRFVFRKGSFTSRARSGDPLAFTGWGKGAAPKTHVSRGLCKALVSAPHPVPEHIAQEICRRLHGARRVYPVAARLASAKLKLTVDDRDELGRWKPPVDPAERAMGRARALSNLYGSDAARPRSVEIRSLVGDEIRRAVAEIGWTNIAPDQGWEFLISRSAAESFPEVEPDLDSEELSEDLVR